MRTKSETKKRRVHRQRSKLAPLIQKLQEGLCKLEEAERIAHIGHWESDLETDAVACSGEVFRIFGLPPRARPMSFQEFMKRVHPEDRAQVVVSVQEAVSRRRRYVIDYRIVRADRGARFVHSEAE